MLAGLSRVFWFSEERLSWGVEEGDSEVFEVGLLGRLAVLVGEGFTKDLQHRFRSKPVHTSIELHIYLHVGLCCHTDLKRS